MMQPVAITTELKLPESALVVFGGLDCISQF
jgi:hypothetical protein